MNICHICNSLLGGGIQNFLLSLLPEQAKQKHHIILIVIEKYDHEYCFSLETILVNHGVEVVCLNKKRKDKMSLLQTICTCRKLILDRHPDIVNTHGTMSHIYGAFSVKGSLIKHVATIHNAPEHWRKTCKLLCKDTPLIFCSNAAFEMKTQMATMMCVIENGISPSIVQKNAIVDLRNELRLQAKDKIIVLVGSLRPQKNYEFLKRIVDEAQDPSLHFCICGGNYGDGYISPSIFNGYEKNIHLLGLRSDVSSIENGADLFLSCALYEGLPIAVLEAYFNGIPCVLSPIPQHCNIANVEKVWIPKSFEPKDFIFTIKEALKETSNHLDIYESRKKQIEKYSITETCLKYIQFYNEILEK
ncbi:MAG: glycosyltransferase [Bacteroidaceae bacterium]|nr:glycosyltransferase [Bacteroidaceae bacterium]